MSSHQLARTTRRRPSPAFRASLVVVGAALVGLLALPVLGSLSAASSFHSLLGGQDTSPGVDDGKVPEGVTAFGDYPAVTNLDPALLDALRRATTEASRHGIELHVTSGWRSPAYQEQLLREATAEHGSEEEAARWVSTPGASLHVSGDAVDVGGYDARAWLAAHGAAHGLCLVYDNEPWHFELRPDAAVHGCPATYADPSQDPRLRD